MKLSLISCLALLPIAAAKLVKLDDSNFDEMTKDKIVFVKFFAPWCGHCKSMAADWEKLADEITDPRFLIAEVDCTDEDSTETCEANDVEGFPTLKFGGGGVLDVYPGSREYNDLLKFASETMKPNCSPQNIEMCDAEQKADIQKYMVMSLEDLEAEIQSIEEMLDDLDDTFEDTTLFLEDEYVKIQDEAERKKSEAKKDVDYSILKAALAKSKMEIGSHSEL